MARYVFTSKGKSVAKMVNESTVNTKVDTAVKTDIDTSTKDNHLSKTKVNEALRRKSRRLSRKDLRNAVEEFSTDSFEEEIENMDRMNEALDNRISRLEDVLGIRREDDFEDDDFSF